MALEQFTNNATTTLDGAINNSTTTITLTSGTLFPAANFRLIIDTEIMFCTSRATNILTVIRGIESTTAASHADDVTVSHIITAGTLDQLKLSVLAAMAIVPNEPSLSADDDNFDDDTFSGWTEVKGSWTTTKTEKYNRLAVSLDGTEGAGGRWTAFLKNKTPNPGDYIQAGFQFTGPRAAFPHVALVMGEGATYNNSDKFVIFGWDLHENYLIRWQSTGLDTSGNVDVIQSTEYALLNFIHMRLTYVSANTYTFQVSIDGLAWLSVWTASSYYTIAQDWVGFAFTTWNAGKPILFNVSYVRFSW